MLTRVVSALIALPLLIFVVLMGNNVLSIAILISSLIALHEIFSVVSRREIQPFRGLCYVLTFLLFIASIFYNNYNLLLVLYVMAISIFSLIITVLNAPKYTFIDAAVTIMSACYIVIGFFHIIMLKNVEQGDKLIWIAFISAWATDTFAYFAGRLFGRKKLIPKVSPKKTIEGALGGLIGCSLLVAIYGVYILGLNSLRDVIVVVVIGFVASMFSQFGDLSASIIKRNCNAKDYGNIMPGHGGILDRFDSILFTTPVVYYCIIFFLG